MCYSAQVVQQLRELLRDLNAVMDYEEAERIFLQRLDHPTLNISRAFEANFDEPKNDAERRIKAAIDAHRQRAATKFERELFTQKTRLVNANRALQTKQTKKSQEEVRIATNKIAACAEKLDDLRRGTHEPKDDRIFPMVYAGVIVQRDGRNVLTPMRYFCRPAGKAASIDRQFPGLYNARRDNLQKFWRGQFGSDHAIAVIDSFYENVKLHDVERRPLSAGESERNVVLQFAPEPAQRMLAACVWSHWSGPGQPDVRGFAAITDDPPQEIAAVGHDRCPITIKPENVDRWLSPAGRRDAELQAILSDRPQLLFKHAIDQAA